MRFLMTIHKTIGYDTHMLLHEQAGERGFINPESVVDGLKSGELLIVGCDVMNNKRQVVATILEMQPDADGVEYGGFSFTERLE